MNFKMTRIRQNFPDNSLLNIREVLSPELMRFREAIIPGSRICIAVGSRGIDNLELIVQETVRFLKELGADPFIIPAMGSHGGATPEGQTAILKDYGITEEKIGAEILSSMDVVEIQKNPLSVSLFMDHHAFNSDGILLINKIKPHTDFRGKYESGLAKMAVIGLGKEKGASAIHQHGVYGLTAILPEAAEMILSTGKIIGGLALIENAYDKTMMIRSLLSSEIMIREPELLETAKKHRPVFPVDHFDVLVLDRMGKNISGAGIDTNIIGRLRIQGQAEPSAPEIKSIVVADLSSESHGNATGIGLADVVTRRLADKIDYKITYKNIITSSFLERGKLPVVAETDREALAWALRSCGFIPEGNEKIIHAKDSLHLDVLDVSEAVYQEIRDIPLIEKVEGDISLLDDGDDLNRF